MPVSRKQTGDNVIYTLEGPLDADMANQFFDLNFADYREIGDAIGALIDFRPMSRPTLSGLNAIQRRMEGVVFDTPVACVGNPDSILRAFISGLEALTSKGQQRIRFFRGEEEAMAEALEWLDGWFENNDIDRDGVRGRHSSSLPPAESTDS